MTSSKSVHSCPLEMVKKLMSIVRSDKINKKNGHALARCIADTGIRIEEERCDEAWMLAVNQHAGCKKRSCVLDDLSQLILHHFTRALGYRCNRHEPCMAELPIMRCQHSGNMLERGGKNCFSANSTGETVERLFVHMRVGVVRWVFRRLKMNM